MKEKFEINIDTNKLQKEFEEMIIKKYREIGLELVYELTQKEARDYTGKVIRKEGTARAIFREAIEQRLLSDNTVRRMQEIIDQKFEQILTECIEDAIRHQVRKTNFGKIVQRTKDTLNAS